MKFEKQRLIGHPMLDQELDDATAAVQHRSSQVTLDISKTDKIIGGIIELHKKEMDGHLSISSHSTQSVNVMRTE